MSESSENEPEVVSAPVTKEKEREKITDIKVGVGALPSTPSKSAVAKETTNVSKLP
jgi:hypothetical protein